MIKMLKIDKRGYFADKIIKIKDSIIGYTNDKEIFRISRITDFSKFKLLDENEQEVDFDKSEKEIAFEKQKMQTQTIANLTLELKKKDKFAIQLAKTVSELNLKINKLEKEGK